MDFIDTVLANMQMSDITLKIEKMHLSFKYQVFSTVHILKRYRT